MKCVRSRTISGWSVAAALILSSLAPPLPAFARAGGKQRFTDNCEVLRAPFEGVKNYQFNQILTGALLGAFAGFASGVLENLRDNMRNRRLTEEERRERANDMGRRIVLGAVGGGLIGYLTSIERHRQNRAELQAALSRLGSERGQYEGLPQKLAYLGNCRNAQYFDVPVQLENGAIDGREAGRRLAKIDEWVAKDDALIAKAAKMEGESITRYAQTLAVIEGESATTAAGNGQQMVARYAGEAGLHESAVEVTYTPAGAAAASEGSNAPALDPRLRWVKARNGANFRQTPGNGTVLGTLPFGTALSAEAAVPGWSRITHEGQAGYISDSLLADEAPVGLAPAPRRATAPRPDIAPGRIAVRPPAARASPGRAGIAAREVGVGRTLDSVNRSVQSSRAAQRSASRSRVTTWLEAAKS